MIHEPRREELLDLTLGLLGTEQARALEAHAAGCPACRAELAALRRTRELVAGLPAVEAPERGAAVVLAAARQAAERAAARRPPRWAVPRWLWGGTLGLAGAAAVAILALDLAPRPVRRGAPEEARDAAPAKGELAGEPLAARQAAAPAAPEAPAVPAAPVATTPEPPAAGATPATPAAKPVERKASPAPPAASLAETADRAAGRPVSAAEPVGSAGAAAPAPAARALRAKMADAARAPEEDQAVPPAPRPAAAMATGAAPAPAPALAAAPPCRLEQRRRIARDAAGLVVGRTRAGRYPAAGGEVPLLVEERFGADGRLRGATVSVGDRLITVGEAEIEAGRLEPLPGVVLARTAAEAARAPPRCEP